MEDKETTIYRASGQALKTNNLAKANAYKTVAMAEASQLEAIEKARGEAKRFILQQAEYSKKPDVYRFRLYMEIMEQVLPKTIKFFSPDEVNTIDLWVAPPRSSEEK